MRLGLNCGNDLDDTRNCYPTLRDVSKLFASLEEPEACAPSLCLPSDDFALTKEASVTIDFTVSLVTPNLRRTLFLLPEVFLQIFTK